MKELFDEKRRLRSSIDEMLKNMPLAPSGQRVLPVKEVSPLMDRMNQIDVEIEAKRRALVQLIKRIVTELQQLASEGQLSLVGELSLPLITLIDQVYKEADFEWDDIQQHLEAYGRHAGRSNFAPVLRQLIGNVRTG